METSVPVGRALCKLLEGRELHTLNRPWLYEQVGAVRLQAKSWPVKNWGQKFSERMGGGEVIISLFWCNYLERAVRRRCGMLQYWEEFRRLRNVCTNRSQNSQWLFPACCHFRFNTFNGDILSVHFLGRLDKLELIFINGRWGLWYWRRKVDHRSCHFAWKLFHPVFDLLSMHTNMSLHVHTHIFIYRCTLLKLQVPVRLKYSQCFPWCYFLQSGLW